MVVSQKLSEQIQTIIRDKVLVLRCHKSVPGHARNVFVQHMMVIVQLQRVLVQVPEQLVRSQYLCNLDQLVVIVRSAKEGFLLKNLKMNNWE
jgi:hypothetical protein